MANMKRAVKAVVQDVESSRRHWVGVRDNYAARLQGATPRQALWIDFERRVAIAAVNMIDSTGKAPGSLVLAEAALELGINS